MIFVHHSKNNKEDEEIELKGMRLQHIGSFDKPQKGFPGGWDTIQKFCSEEDVRKLKKELLHQGQG